jgi:hypothetical protein
LEGIDNSVEQTLKQLVPALDTAMDTAHEMEYNYSDGASSYGSTTSSYGHGVDAR